MQQGEYFFLKAGLFTFYKDFSILSQRIKFVSAFPSRVVFRYYETISEVLSSVRKMEESLKRLKQARKGAAATTTAGANGGLTDDGKIRLQLALDVEYLGEQVGAIP